MPITPKPRRRNTPPPHPSPAALSFLRVVVWVRTVRWAPRRSFLSSGALSSQARRSRIASLRSKRCPRPLVPRVRGGSLLERCRPQCRSGPVVTVSLAHRCRVAPLGVAPSSSRSRPGTVTTPRSAMRPDASRPPVAGSAPEHDVRQVFVTESSRHCPDVVPPPTCGERTAPAHATTTHRHHTVNVTETCAQRRRGRASGPGQCPPRWPVPAAGP